uniref:Uncharacterized protein n=1 Tax=Pseudomonas phage HRDY3 TaxID=3236930 RepID=A0AB39CEG7_9VIRU
MSTLDDIFREEEERLLEKGRAEIARETADWEALPEEEKQRINREREERFANVPDSDKEEPDEEDEEEDDGEYCKHNLDYGDCHSCSWEAHQENMAD